MKQIHTVISLFHLLLCFSLSQGWNNTQNQGLIRAASTTAVSHQHYISGLIPPFFVNVRVRNSECFCHRACRLLAYFPCCRLPPGPLFFCSVTSTVIIKLSTGVVETNRGLIRDRKRKRETEERAALAYPTQQEVNSCAIRHTVDPLMGSLRELVVTFSEFNA